MSTPKKSRHQEYRDRKAAELQELKDRAASLERRSRISAWDEIRTKNSHLRFWRWATLVACIIGIGIGSIITQSTVATPSTQSTTWRPDTPPPITKVHVLTYGFQDQKGVWRSYDNGEPITVQHWKP